MRTLCSMTLAAAAALALASPALADDAVTDLYVARDACGGTTPANTRLSTSLGAFTSGCGSIAGALGGSATTYATAAGDGVPVTLDTSRKVYIAIAVESDPGVVFGGLGDETVKVVLTGKRGSSTVTLGSAQQTTDAATMLRQTSSIYEFELPLDASTAGTYKTITLTLTVGGSQQSGYVNHGGGSFVSLPVPGTFEV